MNTNNRIGIYPGTFDPITFGHINIIKRASKLVDKLIVGVVEQANNKHTSFDVKSRIFMAKDELKRLRIKAEILSFKGLLMKFAKEQNASIIIRGLRTVSDFNYEFKMSLINCKLFPKIETVFLFASANTQFVSSSLVKEIAKLGGSVRKFVPKNIQKELIYLKKDDI